MTYCQSNLMTIYITISSKFSYELARYILLHGIVEKGADFNVRYYETLLKPLGSNMQKETTILVDNVLFYACCFRNCLISTIINEEFCCLSNCFLFEQCQGKDLILHLVMTCFPS